MRKNRTISKILKLKSSKKMELEIEVKKASDRVDEERSKLHGLEKDFSDTLEVFADKSSEGTMNASNITSYYDFFSRINGRINDQKTIHDQRKSELKSAKNSLVEAHKDKRAFEILNDKAIKKDIREKMSLEQKESDFFAITRRLK